MSQFTAATTCGAQKTYDALRADFEPIPYKSAVTGYPDAGIAGKPGFRLRKCSAGRTPD